MGLETGAQFIGELVPAWPLASDPKAEGADHLNIIKRCLQGSFGDMLGLLEFPGNGLPFRGETSVPTVYQDMIKVDANDNVVLASGGVLTVALGRLEVFETTTLRNAVTIQAGGLNMTGTLVVAGGANITGAVSILGGNNLAVTGASTFTGVVNVNSILFANQGLEVAAGQVISSGGLTVNVGSINAVQGGLFAGNGLTVSGGGANITGTLTLAGGANIDGSVSILGGSNLIVSGNGSFTGTLSSGALTVTGGGANITGTLELTGGANIQGSVSIFSNLILASGGNQTINGGVLTVNTVSGEDRGTLLMRRTGADASHFIDFDNNNNASIVNGRYGFYLRDDGYLIIGNDDVDDAFQIFKAGAGVAHVIMNKIAEVDPGIPGALWHMAGDPVVRISL